MEPPEIRSGRVVLSSSSSTSVREYLRRDSQQQPTSVATAPSSLAKQPAPKASALGATQTAEPVTADPTVERVSSSLRPEPPASLSLDHQKRLHQQQQQYDDDGDDEEDEEDEEGNEERDDHDASRYHNNLPLNHIHDNHHDGNAQNHVASMEQKQKQPEKSQESWQSALKRAEAMYQEEKKGLSLSALSTSSHGAGMETSILRFSDLSFQVGPKNQPKFILDRVSGTVKWGHALAIMGPSGAGKTTLINALTLDAYHGKAMGNVTLNGVPMTDHIFKNHCYVVVQHDKHYDYLTCQETLRYAAELYDVAAPEDLNSVVDFVIDKMGLRVCADTRNARLSGGQKRRLSIGMALLKQPTLLFLDEPTSGLDAASAENIMQEIVRVAKEERLIIACTIHQPSTKVYNGFDQVMIMSKGRVAYNGNVHHAVPYFEKLGFPLPEQTNPAEHFLDLVNADFSDDAEVTKILDLWEEKGMDKGSVHGKKGFGDEEDGQEGVTEVKRAPLRKEFSVIIRRSMLLIVRDPILYIGRCVGILIINTIFAVVYIKARSYNQEQAFNKVWIAMWHVGVAANMGVVAVYALNDEFKTILRESKNGMMRPISYFVAKSILVIPIMFIFGVFALGIPSILIMDFPGNTFPKAVAIWACLVYVYECLAEALAVWVDDPILGMLHFTNYWFAAFIFCGILIPSRDLFWPFKLFYYVTPFSYFARSTMYNYLIDTQWIPCPLSLLFSQPVCTSGSGYQVLLRLNLTFDVIVADNTISRDVGIMLAQAFFFKILYLAGVLYKAGKVAKIHPHSSE